MIVIKDSLRSAKPHREAWGDVYFRVYVVLYCFLNRKVKGRQVAYPYGGRCFDWFRSTYCYRNRKVAGRQVADPYGGGGSEDFLGVEDVVGVEDLFDALH